MLVLAALLVTSGLSYRAGQRQVSALAKPKTSGPLFSKEVLNNLSKKTTQKQPAATNLLAASSGFFRLSGTVQSIGKDSVSLKLANGSVIILTTKSTTNYYDGKTKHEIKDLTKNTAVMVTGVIGPDGGFTVSAVQKNK